MVRISIIVATYNRGEQLMRTLNSIAHQSLSTELWEGVIVNNNSSDNTQQIFDEFLKNNPQVTNMRMVFEGRQGLSHARNCGIAESQGEYIAIVDDDEQVSVDFLRDYMEFFDSHPDAAAAGGKIEPLYEYVPPKWISTHVERPISAIIDRGSKISLFPRNRYPIGGNMAFRRTTFEQNGTFDPVLGRTGTKLLAGEEKDLFRRIREAGGEIYWVPGPTILHIIPESRFSPEYFNHLTKMIGVSERLGTLTVSRWAYVKRLGAELVKWCGTLLYAAGYILKLQPSKAKYIIIMRWNITLGLLSSK